jgi:hypothetical protein
MIIFLSGDNDSLKSEFIQKYKDKHSLKNVTHHTLDDTGAVLNITSTQNLWDTGSQITLYVFTVEKSLNISEEVSFAHKKHLIFNYSGTTISTKHKKFFNSQKAKFVDFSVDKQKNLVFKFSDSVFEGSIKKSMYFYNLLKEQNEDDFFYLSSILQTYLKKMAYFYLDKASFNKLHKFEQSKLSNYTKNYSLDAIINIYKYFGKLDTDIKQGHVDLDSCILLSLNYINSCRNDLL